MRKKESRMTPDQAELVERARALLEAEPRIEAAWLAGSLGLGGGDAVSDVDLLALCAEGTRGEMAQVLGGTIRQEFDPTFCSGARFSTS